MDEPKLPATGYNYRFSLMQPEEMRAKLKKLRVSQVDFAEIADMTPEHVNRMVKGSKSITRLVPVLLSLMERTDVWRGDSDWRDWPPVEDQPR